MRSQATEKRGVVYVTDSGSHAISGAFQLVSCEGPLSRERWEELRRLHLVPGERFYGASTYAWHLCNPAPMHEHVPLLRQQGQVVWIKYRSPLPPPSLPPSPPDSDDEGPPQPPTSTPPPRLCVRICDPEYTHDGEACRSDGRPAPGRDTHACYCEGCMYAYAKSAPTPYVRNHGKKP